LAISSKKGQREEGGNWEKAQFTRTVLHLLTRQGLDKEEEEVILITEKGKKKAKMQY